MKRKQLQLLLAVSAVLAGAGTAAASGIEQTDPAIQATITDASGAAETEAAGVAEAETETEDVFLEGSALLSDCGYKAGEITEEGWKNGSLGMAYLPLEGITMGLKENEQLKGYHTRFGEDKQVSNNEMVALDDEDGFVQLMAEVNPNYELAADILGRFCEIEDLELVSEQADMEIAGKVFTSCTGVIGTDRYLLGVCTDKGNIALALKVKYSGTAARKALLSGFTAYEEAPVTQPAETETQAVAGGTEAGLAGDASAQGGDNWAGVINDINGTGATEAGTAGSLAYPDDFVDAAGIGTEAPEVQYVTEAPVIQ